MSVAAVKIRWDGFTGAPGWTTMHFTGSDANGSVPITQVIADAAANLASGFAQMYSGLLPNGVSLQVEPVVEAFDVASKTLEADFTVGTQPVYTGSDTGAFSAAVGAVIHWRTNQIAAGRRVRGRTFLVPIGAGSYGADGTLSDDALTGLQTRANTFLTSSNNNPDATFVVWRGQGKGQTGSTHLVEGYSVPDMTAVLRSRRD